jgi:GNAT superfamily N-acetyltransferase
MHGAPAIRPYVGTDRERLVAVLSGTIEQLGFPFEPAGRDADLGAIQEAYLAGGGCFVVVERAVEIVGSVAVRHLTPSTAELKRLYLDVGLRGEGLGHRLCAAAIDSARQRGYECLRLDTRAGRQRRSRSSSGSDSSASRATTTIRTPSSSWSCRSAIARLRHVIVTRCIATVYLA